MNRPKNLGPDILDPQAAPAPSPERPEPAASKPAGGVPREDGGDIQSLANRRRVCVCPSCGRTEAKIPVTPCHEIFCPVCGIPMREA